MRSVFSGVLARRLVAAGLMVAAFGAAGASSAQASVPQVLSIFAGTGAYGTPVPGPATSSPLGSPIDVATDSSGNVYIADEDDYLVEKVTPSGTLSVIAGNGSYGSPTPGPATSSDLKDPEAVAVDAAGDVYIADTLANEVEKVTPSGTLSIFAGTGTSGSPTPGPATSSRLYHPYALAFDASGDLFIDDENNNLIEKVTPGGTLSIFAGTGYQGAAVPGPATSSGMGYVRGLATDAAGDLYIADDYNKLIEKVTPSGTLSIIAGNGTYGSETPGPALSSDLANPAGLAVDPAGDLYVAGSGSNHIDEITPSGTLSIVAGTGASGAPTAGPPLSSRLNEPYGVALDPAGDAFYIADYSNGLVEKVAPPAPTVTTAPSISGTPVVGDMLTASNGSWSNAPTGYIYQWQDCDSSGANCTNISGATSSSYTVATGDVGHTIRVVVTAQNGGGSTVDDSAVTAAVTSPTTVTPTPTSTGVPVTVGATPAAGITVNDKGEAVITLICPVTPSGCDASGVLTIDLPSDLEARAKVVSANAAAAGDTVLATFSGQQIASGQSALVEVRLRASVLRRLQTLRIHRVKVTLTISNHLSGGPAVNSTQTVFLLIPALARNACPSSTGQISSTTVGEIALGRTRAANRRLDRRYRAYNPSTDNYCLYQGKGIRVVYASAKFLGPAGGAIGVKGHAVLAMTANPFYSLDGVRHGTRLATAARHLKLGKAIQIGRNDWYVIAGARSSRILKVRHGVIIGIGIANRQLTRSRSEQVRLLRS